MLGNPSPTPPRVGRTDRSQGAFSTFIDSTCVWLAPGPRPPAGACCPASAPGGRKWGSGAAPVPRASQHRLNPVHVERHAGEEVGVLAVGTLLDQEGVHGLQDPAADQRAAGVSLGRPGTGRSATWDAAAGSLAPLRSKTFPAQNFLSDPRMTEGDEATLGDTGRLRPPAVCLRPQAQAGPGPPTSPGSAGTRGGESPAPRRPAGTA